MRETLFWKFKSLAPPSAHPETYQARSGKAMRAKFEELSADIQKFWEALRLICTSNPTGVTEDEVLSMAIAKHLGKRLCTSYDARAYPRGKW